MSVKYWIKKSISWSTERLQVIPTPEFSPGRVVWRCQTQTLRCSHCTSGRWLTSGPWPPALSWWDVPRAGPGGSFSKEQWSWGKAGNGKWLSTTTTINTPPRSLCQDPCCDNRTEKNQIYSLHANTDFLVPQETSSQMNLRQFLLILELEAPLWFLFSLFLQSYHSITW